MIKITVQNCNSSRILAIGLLTLAGCNTTDAPGPTIQSVEKYALNDTGVTQFSGSPAEFKSSVVAAPILSTTAITDHPGQDANNGRDADATANDNSDGKAGFSFTKLDDSAKPLADQTVKYESSAWNCVRDNVTGLTWEVKTAMQGPRYKANKYTWYDPDPTTNGGGAGTQDSNIKCGAALASCNTLAYKTYLNTLNSNRGLCGFTDWRVPNREELRSIVDYGAVKKPTEDRLVMIDQDFLGPTEDTDHWTSQSARYNGHPDTDAWELHFDTGQSEAHGKGSTSVVVRLVRGPSP